MPRPDASASKNQMRSCANDSGPSRRPRSASVGVASLPAPCSHRSSCARSEGVRAARRASRCDIARPLDVVDDADVLGGGGHLQEIVLQEGRTVPGAGGTEAGEAERHEEDAVLFRRHVAGEEPRTSVWGPPYHIAEK